MEEGVEVMIIGGIRVVMTGFIMIEGMEVVTGAEGVDVDIESIRNYMLIMTVGLFSFYILREAVPGISFSNH